MSQAWKPLPGLHLWYKHCPGALSSQQQLQFTAVTLLSSRKNVNRHQRTKQKTFSLQNIIQNKFNSMWLRYIVQQQTGCRVVMTEALFTRWHVDVESKFKIYFMVEKFHDFYFNNFKLLLKNSLAGWINLFPTNFTSNSKCTKLRRQKTFVCVVPRQNEIQTFRVRTILWSRIVVANSYFFQGLWG